MRSVGDDLRRETMAHVLALPVAARLELAFSLGEDDLDLFVRANGLSRDEACRRFRANRAGGRTPSVANAPQP